MLSKVRYLVRGLARLPGMVADAAALADRQTGAIQVRLDELAANLEATTALMAARQLEFQRETRLALTQLSLPENWNLPMGAPRPPQGIVFDRSTICRQNSMDSGLYAWWMERLHYGPLWHRKRWEFMFICQALHERGVIGPGQSGLGFGVGGEPLPAYFASQGCALVCTDMFPEAAAAAGWVESAQHAAGLETLRRRYMCSDDLFDANVAFRFCDMNAIAPDLTAFDFCWSACALEHLGSLEHGLAFIESSLRTLKPGGIAVHTTEFNLSSDEETVSEGGTVLYRRRDLEALAARLKANGHEMAPLDTTPGEGLLDRYLDLPPYRDEPHLKLALSGYAATSIGIIVKKAS